MKFLYVLVAVVAKTVISEDELNLEQSLVIKAAHSVLSTSDDSACGSNTLNTIVDLITGGTGSLTIPLDYQMSVPLVGDLNLTSLALSGLDTITSSNILEAVNRTKLRNQLGFASVAATINGRAVKAGLLSSTYERFSITVRSPAPPPHIEIILLLMLFAFEMVDG